MPTRELQVKILKFLIKNKGVCLGLNKIVEINNCHKNCPLYVAGETDEEGTVCIQRSKLALKKKAVDMLSKWTKDLYTEEHKIVKNLLDKME